MNNAEAIPFIQNQNLITARRLLGPEACLVPIIPKSKAPVRGAKYASRPKADFFTSPWESLFEADPEAGVACYLGEISGGLVALDFDGEEDMAAFIEANPILTENALQTRGKRGCQFWFKVHGEFPPSFKTDKYEFRANGNLSMIAGTHPDGMPYVVLNDAAPFSIGMEDITWPDGWKTPDDEQLAKFFTDLEARSCPRYLLSKGKGKDSTPKPYALGEQFWVKYLAETRGFIWVGNESAPYLYHSQTGLWEVTDALGVEQAFSQLLDHHKATGPDSALVVDLFHNSLNLGRLRRTASSMERIQNPFGRKENPVLHCGNVMLVFDQHGDFTSEAFSPFFYSRNRTTIDFEPDATCPRMMSELLEPFLSPESIDLLQCLLGIFLLSSNKMQKVLVLEGKSGSGKSTIMNLIQTMIGKNNCAGLRTIGSDPRFEVSGYIGKSLLLAADVPRNFLSVNEAQIIKSLIGGDTIHAEIKNARERVAVECNFNVMITSNSILPVKLSDDEDAWARRIVRLVFSGEQTSKPVPNFHQVLIDAEGSGILNWIIEGAQRVIREGQLPVFEEQTEAVQLMLDQSQSVSVFVDQCCSIEYGVDPVTPEDLFHSYSLYCASAGLIPLPEQFANQKLMEVIIKNMGLKKESSIDMGSGHWVKGWRKLKIAEFSAPEAADTPFQ